MIFKLPKQVPRDRATVAHAFNADIVMLALTAAGSTCFLLHSEREDDMPESVYKFIELIGTSNESWEKAAANG